MTHLSQPVIQFLDSLREQGYSSPAGMHWHQFWVWLGKQTIDASAQPPKPLILAASGESSDVKHQRLIEQLKFAFDNGFAVSAVDRLKQFP